jgi:hypothetical protein
MSNLHILQLEICDIPIIAVAFAELGWNKPTAQHEQYLAEQITGERVVLVAWLTRLLQVYHHLQAFPLPAFFNSRYSRNCRF